MGTKQRMLRVLTLSAGLSMAAGGPLGQAWADFRRPPNEPQAMTWEEREQMRQQMREHWQQMPPEQREARRRENYERWQQLPAEERQRIREEIRERRSGPEGSRGFPGRREDRR